MTFLELKDNLCKLKLRNVYCNLFDENLEPVGFRKAGLYVAEKGEIWEVYQCEKGELDLLGLFYNESDLYDYILCYYKKHSDLKRWI